MKRCEWNGVFGKLDEEQQKTKREQESVVDPLVGKDTEFEGAFSVASAVHDVEQLIDNEHRERHCLGMIKQITMIGL